MQVEQEIKLEVVRILLSHNVPTERVVEKAIPLLEWILGNNQKQLSSIENTE